MKLDAYLNRIGYEGSLEVTHETLCAIQQHHLLAIPYENVDVQLSRPLTTDVSAAFDKIVNRHRGGWCYEMNGLLGWALQTIGFQMQRVCGAVNRPVRGDSAIGNHLVLLTEIAGTTYLVDAGFGDGFMQPLRLASASTEERGFVFRLEHLDDDFWRLHNHQFGAAPNFDFKAVPADEALLSERCQHLQHAEDSPFVLALVAQRLVAEGYEIQLGRIARSITADGVKVRLLDSPDALLERLATVFGIDEPEVAALWPRICERHEVLFGDQVGDQN